MLGIDIWCITRGVIPHISKNRQTFLLPNAMFWNAAAGGDEKCFIYSADYRGRAGEGNNVYFEFENILESTLNL